LDERARLEMRRLRRGKWCGDPSHRRASDAIRHATRACRIPSSGKRDGQQDKAFFMANLANTSFVSKEH
jgi:hypothetical protein